MKNIHGYDDGLRKHLWIRFDDGKEENRIVAKWRRCDIGANEGGCFFTQEEWDAIAPENKTELEEAKP